MMENNEPEKKNAELSDESEGNPRNDTADSKTSTHFSDIQSPEPSPITAELPNNTATSDNIKHTQTTNSSGEFSNNSSTKSDISISSVSSKEGSHSCPSPTTPVTHQLPYTGSPVPLITLTPVTSESIESDSTEYLHYYTEFNPDGTITVYPIYLCNPTSPSMVDSSQSQLPAFQGNQVCGATAFQFQDPASVCQSNASLVQTAAQSSAEGSQTSTRSNVTVFQRNAAVFQYSNAAELQNNQSNASGYQHVQSGSPVYHDVQSNVSKGHEDPQNSSVHRDQSNSPTCQDDQKSGPVLEGHHLSDPASPQFVPHQESECDDTTSSPSFTTWYGRHAAMESRLVAAVRAVAWNSPKYAELFSNRDKNFRRNKPTSEANLEANIPVSKIPLPPSPTSTSFNDPSLPQTSSSQMELQPNFSISEISSLDQVETTLRKATSSTVSIPPSSAADFKFNFPISEIPLPLDPMPTESSSDPKITEMASSLAMIQMSSAEDFKLNIPISEIPLPLDTPPAVLSPEVEQLTKNFVASIPISEIPLPLNDGATKSLHGNKLPEVNSFSTIPQVNSAGNYEKNFPISEIPLPIDMSQKSVNRNKFSSVESSQSVSENSAINQTCATGYDASFTAFESFRTENMVSEFAKKCTIDEDELEKTKACSSEKLLPAGRSDIINKGKQNPLHKTHYKSNTENNTSVDADKSGCHSTTPNTASNQQDKQKIPKNFRQESNQTIDPKNALGQSKSQTEFKSKIRYPSSKSSMAETEKKTRQTSETRNRSKNASSSSNADKEPGTSKQGISSFTRKESERPTISKEKLSYSKSKVERKKAKFEDSLKATQNESQSPLPKVDIQSDLEKIFQRGFKDTIDSMDQVDLSKLKKELNKIKDTPLQIRTNVIDIELVSSTCTKIKSDEKPKTDIPKIEITEHSKPLPKNAMVQSQLKVEVSPKGAKISNVKLDILSSSTSIKVKSDEKHKIDVPKIRLTEHGKPLPEKTMAQSQLEAAPDSKVAFVKPNTKRGLEQILFSTNCVPLRGPTTLVETGTKNVSPGKKSVPPGVMRTLLRHRDAVQKFIDKKGTGSGDPDETLVLSMGEEKIELMVEHTPEADAVETESTTPKSRKTRRRRSKKKNTKESPEEDDRA